MEEWQIQPLDNIDPYEFIKLENKEAVDKANKVNEEQDYE